jgi:hypothetical protein
MIFEYRSTSYLFYDPLKKHITWMTLNQDGCREEALDFNPPVIPFGGPGSDWNLGLWIIKGTV